MKRLLFVVLTLSLMMACACSFGQDLATKSVTPQSVSEAEEYAVYSALITARYIGHGTRLVVIQDHTGLGLPPEIDLDSSLEYVRESLPDLNDEIIADFSLNNQQSHPLKPLFNLGVKYALVSDEELRQIFDIGDGWEQFYKTYPHSQGDMTLSRVGFNPNMDMALVYVGNQEYWLAGAGFYYLMIKENGAWIVSDEIMTWIS